MNVVGRNNLDCPHERAQGRRTAPYMRSSSGGVLQEASVGAGGESSIGLQVDCLRLARLGQEGGMDNAAAF